MFTKDLERNFVEERIYAYQIQNDHLMMVGGRWMLVLNTSRPDARLHRIAINLRSIALEAKDDYEEVTLFANALTSFDMRVPK